MGVTGLYAFLREQFPTAKIALRVENGRNVVSLVGGSHMQLPHFDHVFFDCNSQLYTAAARLQQEERERLAKRLWENLDMMLNSFTKMPMSVLLALDGPGTMRRFCHGA
jgi:hypothetical protein